MILSMKKKLIANINTINKKQSKLFLNIILQILIYGIEYSKQQQKTLSNNVNMQHLLFHFNLQYKQYLLLLEKTYSFLANDLTDNTKKIIQNKNNIDFHLNVLHYICKNISDGDKLAISKQLYLYKRKSR